MARIIMMTNEMEGNMVNGVRLNPFWPIGRRHCLQRC